MTETALMEAPQRAIQANGTTPSVESMLMLAIERGVDPAALEKLVELQERVAAKRAEMAFNQAMTDFRAECKFVGKNREAEQNGKHMYDYADLPQIMATVDPVLHAHGLTYTFDFKLADKVMTTICTVHHVDGHSRSASFTCETSGTKMMNAAQMAGSATTYGRRYALQGVLGICTDYDDDGRAAAPSPKPDADQAAPKVGTRAERSSGTPDDGAPRVTTMMLNHLFDNWKAKFRASTPTRAEFSKWAAKTLHTDVDLMQVSNWTIDAVEAVREALSAK